jgi:hypothetical protein
VSTAWSITAVFWFIVAVVHVGPVTAGLRRLRGWSVVMAGENEYDPYKD